MSGKNLLEGRGPITQSVDAVRTLLTWKGHPTNPMPADVSLDNGRLILVLSRKKDAYYTCTKKACSCPSAAYRPGQSCKHQRKYFPVEATPRPTDCGSIKPAGRWAGGYNGPVEDDLKAAV